jgi:hypothetical protein
MGEGASGRRRRVVERLERISKPACSRTCIASAMARISGSSNGSRPVRRTKLIGPCLPYEPVLHHVTMFEIAVCSSCVCPNSGRIVAASSAGGIASHHGWLLVIRALNHAISQVPVTVETREDGSTTPDEASWGHKGSCAILSIPRSSARRAKKPEFPPSGNIGRRRFGLGEKSPGTRLAVAPFPAECSQR